MTKEKAIKKLEAFIKSHRGGREHGKWQNVAKEKVRVKIGNIELDIFYKVPNWRLFCVDIKIDGIKMQPSLIPQIGALIDLPINKRTKNESALQLATKAIESMLMVASQMDVVQML